MTVLMHVPNREEIIKNEFTQDGELGINKCILMSYQEFRRRKEREEEKRIPLNGKKVNFSHMSYRISLISLSACEEIFIQGGKCHFEAATCLLGCHTRIALVSR